jgi:hypothetical protein
MYRHTLEELCVSGFMIGQSAMNTIIDASGLKIGLKLRVDRRRMSLIKPPVQFIYLLRRERVYGAFDFPNRIHGLSPFIITRLLQNPTLRLLDEPDQVGHVFAGQAFAFEAFDGLRSIQLGGEE